MPKVIKKRRKSNRKINIKGILVVLISLTLFFSIIVGSVGLFVLGNMLQDKPTLDIANLESKESSKIFDKDGNQIADIGKQIRTNVTYYELPESLIDSFVSIEDSRFFKHSGFDVARFIKSMLENIRQMRFAQGGSTMTMQLIKLSYYIDDEAGIGAPKKIERKVQEIALALELEKNIDKKRILELYLNKMNFGGSGNIRGIQKASQYYFNKNASELNTAESAMLSGIVNRPSAYNPFNYLDYATKRRNTVINMMVKHGYLKSNEAKLIKKIKLEDTLFNPANSKGGNAYQYQSYIDTVLNEAKELTGLDPQLITMNIYTTMDPKIQQTMDSIQADEFEDIQFPDELMETAMISLNNNTGEIVAIGGGRNYGRGGSLLLNHATQQYKQPGSSVKPFLSYALAFEYLGWASDHVVVDRPIVYKGTSKVIKNANNTYVGQVKLDYALGNSLNTPAIQTLQEVIENTKNGRSIVVKYLQDLGFSKVTNDNFDIGFAIGGSNYTSNAVELAGAHAAIANHGKYIKPHTITKIEFKNGGDPITPGYEEKQVISPEAAYLAIHLMYEVVNGPYTNYMQILKRDYPVYGKTGTTDWGSDGLSYNIPQGAAKDKWMVSETSKYTTVVWVGYEKGIKDKDTYFSSAKSKLNLPGKISNKILSSLTDEIKPEAISRPEGVQDITHIIATFPYASVIEGMDNNFISKGLIKAQFNKTVSPEEATVEKLNSFNASINDNGLVNVTWSKYPDESKLNVASDVMDLGVEVNGNWIPASGKRIFDYTWLFGPIKYKAKIMSNNQVVDYIVSDSENAVKQISLPPNSNINVCGYYEYENVGGKSNEICTDFKTSDQNINISVPNSSASEQDIKAWQEAYGFKVEYSKVSNSSKSNTNEITYNGVVVNEQTISTTLSQISNIEFKVTLYTN